MKLKFLVFIIALLFANPFFSQEKDRFSFKILDNKTRDPISFATVVLKRLNKGTHADVNGVFHLPIYVKENDTMTISSIGYKTSNFYLNSYSKDSLNVIFIDEDIFYLDEIKVVSNKNSRRKNRYRKKLDAKEIIREAINKIPENYPTKPHSYIAYYRDYLQPTNDIYIKSKDLKEQSDYLNLNEGILEVFDAGYHTEPIENDKNQTVLYDLKSNSKFIQDSTLQIPYDNHDQKLTKSVRIQPFGGNEFNILNITNPIRNSKSQSLSFIDTLSLGFIEKHEFKLNGLRKLNNTILYEISFSNKKEKTTWIHTAKGKIYISKDNYAIYKLTYNLFDLLI